MSTFCRKRSQKSNEKSSKRRMTIELRVPSDDDSDDGDEVPIVETTNKTKDNRSRIQKTKHKQILALAPTKLFMTKTPKSEPDRVMLEEAGTSTTPLLTVASDTEDCKPWPRKVPSTDESDQEEESVCPTMDSLKNSCWKCSAKFRLAKDEFCLYAMHMHPLLKVPICSVCAEEVLAVELQSSHGDWCSGCGRHEDDVEMLLLCDDCPRAFCDTCTALAHGGGQPGQEEANRLAESHDSWSCPNCKPPPPLETLQQHTERIGSQEETRQRTVEDIMMELDKVELERMECEKTTLPQVLEHKLEEFRNELRKTCSSPTDLQEAVESEMQDWQEMWSRHDQRLADLAASLQDELEMHENIDLAACYRQLEGKTTIDTDEPDWKRAADAAIDRREQEEDENDEPPVAISDSSVYKRDIGDDEIEDLDTPDPEGHQKKSQWRHNRAGARKEDIDEALKFEEEMLRLRSCTVTRVCNDNQDVKEIEEEEHEASARGAGGVSRIRRDVYQVVSRQAPRSTECNGPRAPKMPRAAHTDSGQPVVDAGCLKDDNVANLNEADSVDSVENDVTLNSGANIFSNSSLVLSSASLVEDDTVDVSNPSRKIKTVTIAEPLAKVLKSHQVEGVRFMWRNTFSDLAYTGATSHDVENVGGCVLAHNMGLGKSLSCIALVHALLNHPNLVLHRAQHPASRLIRCILLVVPLNVLFHWEEEFEKWTGELVSSVQVYNLGAVGKEACAHTIKIWSRRGGVLLVSKGRFVSLKKSGKYNEALQDPGPDVVIADEGHLMLTKTSNEIFKALSGIRSKRRIALTGSPIQNNLLEYFRMVSWVRPGVLGTSEKVFNRQYVEPIMMGMASDSSASAVHTSNKASRELYQVLFPYVHRKDAKVLRKDLPPMQQCVLHIRQSKTQVHLYRAFKRLQKAHGDYNFFRCYHMTRPLTNHPGTLLISGQNNEYVASCDDGTQRVVPTSAAVTNKPIPANVVSEAAIPTEKSATNTNPREVETIFLLSDSEGEGMSLCERVPPTAGDTKESPNDSPVRKEVVNSGVLDTNIGKDPITATGHTLPSGEKEWWRKTAERNGKVENLKDIENGYKVVLLLHILVHAQELGDKVLLFSQCLRTLDFIEEVLNLEDWGKHTPSLASSFPDSKFGAWRKNVDYLRIDGETKSTERGSLINQFNDMKSSEQERITADDDKTKLFLLSAKAGGIGVNLVAANRVVLFDNHFNPTVMTQALYRCYRYGQSKPVFAYRFMTEGSMEEKIYSRSVNKSGVALRVIDGKSIGRHFTEKELQDLQTTDNWVQCDGCEKWRRLPFNADLDELPDKWYCDMNKDDVVNNKCSASEKDAEWYGRHFSDQLGELKDSPVKCIVRDSSDSAIPQDQKASLVARDEILKRLLEVTADKRKKSVISKYLFHDALLEETEDDVFEAVDQGALCENSEKASSSTAVSVLNFPATEAEPSEKESTKNLSREAVAQAVSSCEATDAEVATPPTKKRFSTPSAVNPNNKKKESVSPHKLKTPNTAPSKYSDQTKSQPPKESKLKRQGTPSSVEKDMRRIRVSPRGAEKAETTKRYTPRKVKLKNLREDATPKCHGTATSSTAKREKAHRRSPLRLEADSTDSSRKLKVSQQQQESKEGEFIDLLPSSSVSKAEVIDLVDSTDSESVV